MNITEKAKAYAEEKALKGINTLIEQAYLDGYNDGLKHFENEKLERIKDGVEYVDLGLPSGTLWSSVRLKNAQNITKVLPYIEASKLNIPTKEQFEELFMECHHRNHYYKSTEIDGLIFTGKNGNSILIEYATIDGHSKTKRLCFWLKDEKESNVKLSAKTNIIDRKLIAAVDNIFMGLKLPVMLVVKK